MSFIEMLSKTRRGIAVNSQFFERAIKPDKTKLESFRAKAEDLPESLKSKADDIKFEWFPMTYLKYVEQKKENDVKFDVIHFLHTIYYVGSGTGLETALKHCYETELGPKGVIFFNYSRFQLSLCEIWQSIFFPRLDFEPRILLQQQRRYRCG